MQKALTQMNLRLTNVLSDITGVTGLKIIRAIVAGEHDGHKLAEFRDERCKKSEAEIAKSLEGHYKREHLFALQQALELYDFYDRQLEACDAELEAMYQEFEPPEDPSTPPPQPRTQKRRKNQAHFDLRQALYRLSGLDLTEIDGIDALTLQKVLSETGTDMSKWPTVKHFTSWLHLCPNNKITGGKVKQRGVQPTRTAPALPCGWPPPASKAATVPWALITAACAPALERQRRSPPPPTNWLVSSTIC
jgi:hypothetical protein